MLGAKQGSRNCDTNHIGFRTGCYHALPKKTHLGIWSQLFRYLSVGAVLQKFVGDGLPELLTCFAQPKQSPTHHNRAMFLKIDVEKVVQAACVIHEYHHVTSDEAEGQLTRGEPMLS